MEIISNIIFLAIIYLVVVRRILQQKIKKDPQSPRIVYILYQPLTELRKFIAGSYNSKIKTASYTTTNHSSHTHMTITKGKIFWILVASSLLSYCSISLS